MRAVIFATIASLLPVGTSQVEDRAPTELGRDDEANCRVAQFWTSGKITRLVATCSDKTSSADALTVSVRGRALPK
jgi:hypothetical protein